MLNFIAFFILLAGSALQAEDFSEPIDLAQRVQCDTYFGESSSRLWLGHYTAPGSRDLLVKSEKEESGTQVECDVEGSRYICKWGSYSYLSLSLNDPVRFAGAHPEAHQTFLKGRWKPGFFTPSQRVFCRFLPN